MKSLRAFLKRGEPLKVFQASGLDIYYNLVHLGALGVWVHVGIMKGAT